MKALTVVLLILATAVPFSEAQEKAKPDQIQEGTVQLRAELVELDVIVTDAHGRPIRDLQRDDFEVYEDGVKQEIVTFEPVIETPGLPAGVTNAPPRIRSERSREFELLHQGPSGIVCSISHMSHSATKTES